MRRAYHAAMFTAGALTAAWLIITRTDCELIGYSRTRIRQTLATYDDHRHHYQ